MSSQNNKLECDVLVAATNEDSEVVLYELLHNGNLDISRKWCPVGTQAIIGEFLMQRFYRPDMDLKTALRMCWFVIKEIMRSDPYVGGEIRLGYIERGEPYVEVQDVIKKEIDNLAMERRSIHIDELYHHLFNDDFSEPL